MVAIFSKLQHFIQAEKTVDAIELLLNRNSRPILQEPGPDQQQEEIIFKAALRAPDHGLLRPWKFLTVEGEARDDLGRILLQVMTAESELSDKEQTKLLNAPLRAPLVIIAITDYQEHPKVPKIEQVLSTGSAVQQMLLAAEALGFGGIWRTGPVSHLPALKTALGLTERQSIIGFLYIGTPAGSEKSLQPLETSDFFSPMTVKPV